MGSLFEAFARALDAVRHAVESRRRREAMMELFGGERGGAAAQGSATGTVQKVERALEEAIQARQEGRPEEAVERAGAALTWLDAGNVRRELRVGLPRELGFAHLLLGQTAKAREALLLSLEQAAHDPTLADPVRAGLATLELMVGSPERARHMLDARGRNRRATLSAVARIALYEGDFQAAEQALQEADQAPGGTTATGVLHPPATVLRCFGAIWGKRPDQARMLYDGVATRDNPMWDLVRLGLLRALWVQSGDGRYLQLAGGAAEQMRFSEAAAAQAAPGFQAAVASMHATVLALSGELGLAVEAADQALAHLGAAGAGSLTLPEWPRPAVLADCAMVYRDAGQTARWLEVLAQWDPLAWSGWAERMTLVSGARAKGATTPDEAKPIVADGGASFEALAIRLLEDPRNARLAALRGVAAMAAALGVEWTDAEGKVLGRIGARAATATEDGADKSVERVQLGDGSVLAFYKPQRDAVRRLERAALDSLARVVAVREEEAQKLGTLHDAMTTADAARRLAEERLEQARRPGTDKGHGGRFPTVVGRSDKLRAVLDRLGSLASLAVPVLLEGAPGTGRRHLAQALFLALSEDPTGSSRAPMLDAGLVPEEAQKEALERLAKGARGGTAIVANAGALGAEASSWLLDELASARPGGARWVATLDQREAGPLGDALRKAFGAGLVRVPGLDERLEDLPQLTDQFVREAGRRPDDVSTATRAALARRVFAGHVAELRSLVRVATVRAGAQTVQPEHLERADAATGGPSEAMSTDEALTLGYRDAVRTFQRALLQRALEATAGHNGRAADLLGMPRPQLVKLARELEVGLDSGPGASADLGASDEAGDAAVAV